MITGRRDKPPNKIGLRHVILALFLWMAIPIAYQCANIVIPAAVRCVLDPCGGGQLLMGDEDNAILLSGIVARALEPFALREEGTAKVFAYKESTKLSTRYVPNTSGSTEVDLRIDLRLFPDVPHAKEWLSTSLEILLGVGDVDWRERASPSDFGASRVYENVKPGPYVATVFMFSHDTYTVEVQVRSRDREGGFDLSHRVSVELMKQLAALPEVSDATHE